MAKTLDPKPPLDLQARLNRLLPNIRLLATPLPLVPALRLWLLDELVDARARLDCYEAADQRAGRLTLTAEARFHLQQEVARLDAREARRAANEARAAGIVTLAQEIEEARRRLRPSGDI